MTGRERILARADCLLCGRRSHRAAVKFGMLCGPCFLGKPLTWWPEALVHIKQVCGLADTSA